MPTIVGYAAGAVTVSGGTVVLDPSWDVSSDALTFDVTDGDSEFEGDADENESVGYGAERVLGRPTKIATLAGGYADGLFRQIGIPGARPGGTVYFDDHPAPVLGRISMDLLCVDVTDIPGELVFRGAFAEVIGPHVPVDDIAERAGTIGYEILTALGQRFERKYVGQ